MLIVEPREGDPELVALGREAEDSELEGGMVAAGPDRSPSLYRMRPARPSGLASCGRNSPTRPSESPASVFGEAQLAAIP
jgi:hypothetical protein